MVWSSFRAIFYLSNYCPNNLQKKQNMALKCEMINSVVPNASSRCWDQFQQLQAPKIAIKWRKRVSECQLTTAFMRNHSWCTHTEKGTCNPALHFQRQGISRGGCFKKAEAMLQQVHGRTPGRRRHWRVSRAGVETRGFQSWQEWGKEGWGDVNLPVRGLHSKDKRELVKPVDSPAGNKAGTRWPWMHWGCKWG